MSDDLDSLKRRPFAHKLVITDSGPIFQPLIFIVAELRCAERIEALGEVLWKEADVRPPTVREWRDKWERLHMQERLRRLNYKAGRG